jgi:uncharacterized protein
MRRHISLVLTAMALLAMVAAVALVAPSFAPPASAAAESEAGAALPRYITVVGQGRASVTPDIAILSLGAETQAEGIRDAIDANDAIMAAVVTALDKAGIAEKDIQTSNYSIYFDEGYGGPGVDAQPVYRVSNMVTVKIRDLKKVGDVLDSVIAAGANRIYGVSFTLEDWAPAEANARADAVKDAGVRAGQLAQLAGLDLGEVLSLSEVVGGAVPMYANMAMPAAMSLSGGGSSVAPGELEVTMSVQVTYAVQ